MARYFASRYFGPGASAGTTFTIPTTPSSSTADKVPLAPSWTAGPTGLDQYRPLRPCVVDGELYVCNGFDTPRRWDRANNAWNYMGSTAPTTFALALSAAGAPAAIPTGQTARYYLVGYNSATGKETAPQGGGEVTIANASGGTRDVTITWTASEFPSDTDFVRAYRALNTTDDFKRVNGDGTAVATATYLDVTPDATLRALSVLYTWDGATRTTLPSAFTFMFEDGGRIYGAERSGDFLSYGQPIRAVGTSVVEDFRSGNILQIGADDGTGPPTAGVPFHGTTVIFKRAACYEKTGDSPLTFEVRRLSGSRGTFNPCTVVPLDKWLICLDVRGIYRLTTGLFANGGGSVEEIARSPFQPILDRLNLGAADTFHAVHLETQSVIVFWVALDFDPEPQHGIVFDYIRGRFMGLLTRRTPTASGYWLDSSGVRHPAFGCDMGYVWEDLYAESEGVFAGDNTATATSESGLVLTASGAAFNTTAASGVLGAPMEEYTTAGVVTDENRVYSATGTALTRYLYPTTAFATGNTLAVGVIPAVLETGQFDFSTHESKDVKIIFLQYDSGPQGSVRLDTAVNDSDFALKFEQSMATGVRALIATANVTSRNLDRCWVWRLRIAQRYANIGFAINAIHVQYTVVPGRQS